MIRVEERKHPQHDVESSEYLSPKKLVIPLSQNLGKPSSALVKAGDQIGEGDLIADAGGFVSSLLHAPRSGKVTAVDRGPHPLLKRALCVYMQCDETRRTYPLLHGIDALTPEEIVGRVRQSGIVGMGGACFPTHVKLKPPKKIDTLLINGCECEPYLSCDNRLMVEKAKEIFTGVELISRVLTPERVIFCIEGNKPQAIKRFNRYISTKKFDLPPAELKILKSGYPQGGEKQLIYSALKRKVPTGRIPFEIGCLVQNVATCFAVYEAVYFGKPLTERMVTFAGDCLVRPRNLWVKTGTLISELVQQGVLVVKGEPKKVVFGGPMMGIAVDSLDYPVLKGTSGVLFLSEKSVAASREGQCIRCGRCVDACPMGLVPLEYVKRIKAAQFDRLDEVWLKDCIECGSCAYSCPAKIPIVHYVKRGKSYAS